jgi:hypothetical protein
VLLGSAARTYFLPFMTVFCDALQSHYNVLRASPENIGTITVFRSKYNNRIRKNFYVIRNDPIHGAC